MACLFLAAPGYAIADGPPAWLAEAAAFLPDGYVLGQIIAAPEDGGTASIAVFPAGADDPAEPGSTFDPGHVLVVTLETGADGPAIVAGELRERAPIGPEDEAGDGTEADYAAWQREIWIKGQQSYPSGTEPCESRGWSIDEDPAGLAVHLKPSADSRVLGTLPPRYGPEGADEAAPEDGFFTEFDIIGYSKGWFLIEHAEPPGRDYFDPDSYPDDHPEPFAGRGWIPVERVGAQFANGDMPVRARDGEGVPIGGLYQAPSVDSAWTPAHDAYGSAISADGGPKRILACSGFWALVESDDGVVGWWRRLCSNQVTTCS
ncbi:MAG: SH3 domain-containing protein [Bauldia sp.]|nr:SH3 domain-containing protein [Bauldia sp.]